MQSKATTVAAYLKELNPDRRKAITALRKVIKANLDPRIKETMSYGMIGYVVPHSVFPDGYHCTPDQPLPFANLASQKNHLALYLFAVYGNEKESAWLAKAWKAAGKKLDMGKSCLRFKSIDDVPLEVVGEAIRRIDLDDFMESYAKTVASTKARKKKPAAKKKSTAKKASRKKK